MDREHARKLFPRVSVLPENIASWRELTDALVAMLHDDGMVLGFTNENIDDMYVSPALAGAPPEPVYFDGERVRGHATEAIRLHVTGAKFASGSVPTQLRAYVRIGAIVVDIGSDVMAGRHALLATDTAIVGGMALGVSVFAMHRGCADVAALQHIDPLLSRFYTHFIWSFEARATLYASAFIDDSIVAALIFKIPLRSALVRLDEQLANLGVMTIDLAGITIDDLRRFLRADTTALDRLVGARLDDTLAALVIDAETRLERAEHVALGLHVDDTTLDVTRPLVAAALGAAARLDARPIIARLLAANVSDADALVWFAFHGRDADIRTLLKTLDPNAAHDRPLIAAALNDRVETYRLLRELGVVELELTRHFARFTRHLDVTLAELVDPALASTLTRARADDTSLIVTSRALASGENVFVGPRDWDAASSIDVQSVRDAETLQRADSVLQLQLAAIAGRRALSDYSTADAQRDRLAARTAFARATEPRTYTLTYDAQRHHFTLANRADPGHEVFRVVTTTRATDGHYLQLAPSGVLESQIAAGLPIVRRMLSLNGMLDRVSDSWAYDKVLTFVKTFGDDDVTRIVEEMHVSATNILQDMLWLTFGTERFENVERFAAHTLREAPTVHIREVFTDTLYTMIVKTTFMRAVSIGAIDIVRALFAVFAPIIDPIIQIALENAITANRIDAVRAVVAAGGSFSADHNSLFISAMQGKNLDIVKFALRAQGVNIRGSDESILVEVAIIQNAPAILELLLDSYFVAPDNIALLLNRSLRDHFDNVVKVLVTHGVSVASVDENTFEFLATTHRVTTINMLVRLGAVLSDELLNVMLFRTVHASKNGSAKVMVHWLLAHGANQSFIVLSMISDLAIRAMLTKTNTGAEDRMITGVQGVHQANAMLLRLPVMDAFENMLKTVANPLSFDDVNARATGELSKFVKLAHDDPVYAFELLYFLVNNSTRFHRVERFVVAMVTTDKPIDSLFHAKDHVKMLNLLFTESVIIGALDITELMLTSVSATLKPEVIQQALEYAIVQIHVSIVRSLVSAGASFSIKNNALFHAVIGDGDLAMVKLAMSLQGDDVLAVDKSGGMAVALRQNKLAILEFLLTTKSVVSPATTIALEYAATRGYDRIVEFALTHGFSPEAVNKDVFTYLAEKHMIAMVKLLVRLGVPISRAALNTMLIVATQRDNANKPMIRWLLQRGANPNVVLPSHLHEASVTESKHSMSALVSQYAHVTRVRLDDAAALVFEPPLTETPRGSWLVFDVDTPNYPFSLIGATMHVDGERVAQLERGRAHVFVGEQTSFLYRRDKSIAGSVRVV